MSLKKPKHFATGPSATLAGGKTYDQLHEDATRAMSIGMVYWPKIVIQLLETYAHLVEETEKLRQPDLLAPSQMHGKPTERNGV